MNDMTDILERLTLRNLGHFIMEGRTGFERESGEVMSEKQVKMMMEDELRLALKHGWKNPEERFRSVAERNWRNGEMVGFMKGMQVGARLILALVGEGDVRI